MYIISTRLVWPTFLEMPPQSREKRGGDRREEREIRREKEGNGEKTDFKKISQVFFFFFGPRIIKNK